MRPVGIDLSKYDLSFNPKSASLKADFVIQRVGYGGFWGTQNKDERFDALLPGVMDVPVRGGYWYLSSHSNWKKQADYYLEKVAGIDYHFHCVDFESDYNDLSVDFGAACVEWMRYVKDNSGKRVALYANRSHYDEFLAPDYRVKEFPLWISSPVTADPQVTQPPMPKKRSDWTIWQYVWTVPDARLWGVGRPQSIDLNVWNGTIDDMLAFCGISDAPASLPTRDECIDDLLHKSGYNWTN